MNKPNTFKPPQHRLLFILISVALLLLVAVAVVLLIKTRPQLSSILPFGTPTQPCVMSRLFIGPAEFRIDPAPSGSADVRSAIPLESGQVYWVATGNASNYALVFNPDRENQLLLVGLQPEAVIAVTWEDCTAGTYMVDKVEVLDNFDLAQADQSLVGVFLYLPLDSSGRALVVTARLVKFIGASNALLAATSIPPTSTAGLVPAVLPTQACPAPGLSLGTAALTIENGIASAVKTLNIEPATFNNGDQLSGFAPSTGVAYLLTSTPEHRVFILGLEVNGLDSSMLGGLTEALVTGGDCTSTLYQLSPMQQVDITAPGLLDSLQSELGILILEGSGQAGYLLQGTSTAVLTIPPTAVLPVEGEIQVEVGILAISPASIGDTFDVKVSIYNYGAAPLPVASDNIQLNSASLNQAPILSTPGLPVEIAPGQTLELTLTFIRPSDGWGVLKVFTLEYNLEDFIQ